LRSLTIISGLPAAGPSSGVKAAQPLHSSLLAAPDLERAIAMFRSGESVKTVAVSFGLEIKQVTGMTLHLV
jgi:hypothetical protein